MSEVFASSNTIAAPQAKILCVDDEPNILSSLRRLLRGQGYQIFLAEGGNAGSDSRVRPGAGGRPLHVVGKRAVGDGAPS